TGRGKKARQLIAARKRSACRFMNLNWCKILNSKNLALWSGALIEVHHACGSVARGVVIKGTAFRSSLPVDSAPDDHLTACPHWCVGFARYGRPDEAH